MQNLNKVMVAGKLIATPELRYTASQRPVCVVLLALEGAEKDAIPYQVSVWDAAAERLAHEVAVGDDLIFPDARLKARTWKERNGTVRYGVEVSAWGYWRPKATPPVHPTIQASAKMTFADRVSSVLEKQEEREGGDASGSDYF